MKRKNVKERNQFVALSLFRKAGVHRKINKALRRQEKSSQRKIATDTYTTYNLVYESSFG